MKRDTYASFTAATVQLSKNADAATIKMCIFKLPLITEI